MSESTLITFQTTVGVPWEKEEKGNKLLELETASITRHCPGV